MFDTLQPTSLIPYERETKKNKTVSKPAVIIPLKPNSQTHSPKNKKKAGNPFPFHEWKMPEQEEGYIKGNNIDLLWFS